LELALGFPDARWPIPTPRDACPGHDDNDKGGGRKAGCDQTNPGQIYAASLPQLKLPAWKVDPKAKGRTVPLQILLANLLSGHP
jgi:hypothetical protein